MSITDKNKKILYILATVILAFASMYAVAALQNIQGETWCVTNQILYSFTTLTAAIGIADAILVWRFLKLNDTRLKIVSIAFGVIVAFVYVIGWMLQYENNISKDMIVVAMSLISIPAGLFANVLDYASKHYNSRKVNEFFTSKEDKYSKWKVIFFYHILFFVSFIPAFMAYYPGLLVYDAQYQFTQVYNGFMTTHHPVIHMLLIKLAYNIGTALSCMNKGFAVISLLQMLTLSFSFAYGVGFLREIRVSRKVRVIVAIVLIIFPINAVYSISVTKDVFFAAFFLLYVIETLNIYRKEKLTISSTIFYIIVTVLMILFRKNALYAFALSIPFIVLAMKGKRKRMIIIMLLSLIIATQTNKCLQNSQGAFDNSGTREMMSLPIQQIARVYSYNEEARNDMQDVLELIPEELLLSYNPYISDGVKNNIDNDLLKENLGRFIKIWINVGLKYPGEYMEAFLTNTMGYWYIDDTEHARIYGEGGYMRVEYSPENFYNLVEPKCFLNMAKSYYDALFLKNGYQNIPLISIMFRPAFYFVLYLIGIAVSIYLRKYKLLFPIIPVICYFLTVLLAPVAIVRYVYCLILAFVFIAVWGIRDVI